MRFQTCGFAPARGSLSLYICDYINCRISYIFTCDHLSQVYSDTAHFAHLQQGCDTVHVCWYGTLVPVSVLTNPPVGPGRRQRANVLPTCRGWNPRAWTRRKQTNAFWYYLYLYMVLHQIIFNCFHMNMSIVFLIYFPCSKCIDPQKDLWAQTAAARRISAGLSLGTCGGGGEWLVGLRTADRVVEAEGDPIAACANINLDGSDLVYLVTRTMGYCC